MMNAYKLCPTKYIAAPELEDDTVVTIESIETDVKVGIEEEVKPVMHTHELDRGVVLNKTNVKTIIKWHGMETDDWIGKKITLYPTTCQNRAGQTVPCIRVREKK